MKTDWAGDSDNRRLAVVKVMIQQGQGQLRGAPVSGGQEGVGSFEVSSYL